MTYTQSILDTVRGAMGLVADDTSFDSELIIHINSNLATLYQNGVGLPITVEDSTALWSDLKDESKNNDMFEQIKTYIFLRTKLLFDPPPPSTAKYMDEAATELLWRLRCHYDVPTT